MTSKLSTHGSLARSAGVIGSFTFLSRILGFLRDILIASCFGTTLAAEAFVVSFKLPNLLRDLVGEGAMNAAFVPVLTETHALKGEEEFRRLSSALFYWLMLLLLAMSAAGVLFAPWVVRVIAPGFFRDPEKYLLTVELTRLLFPFIFLIGLSAFFMGFLNTLKNFATSAMGSMILNVCMIIALVFAVPEWGTKALAAAVLIGGFAQCLVQGVSLLRLKVRFVFGQWFHPGIIKILKLSGPRIWGTAVYQVSVFVDTVLASFYWIVGDGGQSALYYSSRLFQLPLAIFGVSLAQASLPTLSGHAARKDHAEFRNTLEFSLKNMIFATLPAAAGLALFAGPIVRVLFHRGEFGEYSATVTSQALFCYALGLVSCGLIKILVNAFYALQDTRTPVRTATVALFLNIALNLALMGPLKIAGLALATALAATGNAAMLYVALALRLGPERKPRLGGMLWKATGATAVMVVVGVLWLKPWVDGAPARSGSGLWELLASITAGVAIYFAAAWAMKMEEARSFKKFFMRRS